MTDLLLLFAFVLTFATAIGWLFAYRNISKSLRLRDSRSGFDVNLQSTILRHLFSSNAAERLGVKQEQVTIARSVLIVGLVSQATLITLLVTRYQ